MDIDAGFEDVTTLSNVDLKRTITAAQVSSEVKPAIKKNKIKGVDKLEKMDGVESTTPSRPPSPPESGKTTPRVTIAPCPPRLRSLIPPPNYGTVDLHAIYRSSFPQDRNMDFVKTLKIRSVLTLVDTDPTPDFQQWIDEYGIKQFKVDIATNKDGNVNTSLDSICEAMLFLMDKNNHPVYVHCNQGKHRTGCVVACFRKIQKMPMDNVVNEYVAYSSPKVRSGDVDLINNFNPDVVFDYAKKQGYLDRWLVESPELESKITNIDTLAEALLSGAFGPWQVDSGLTMSRSSTVSDGPIEMTLSRVPASTPSYSARARRGSNMADAAVFAAQSMSDNVEVAIMDFDFDDLVDTDKGGKAATLGQDSLSSEALQDSYSIDEAVAVI